MSKLIRWGHRKIIGFSLLELMVVVAIIGVLATVAVPRFNIFRARARQSEAKNNLGVIYTLQEAFNIDHEQYYNGNANTWGGVDMHTHASRDGYAHGGNYHCTAAHANNKLGFRLANCERTRYGYWMYEGNETEFMAIAFAPSDHASDKRIFPGCPGTTPATRKYPGSSGGNLRCRSVSGADYAAGDAWCLDEGRKIENYRDITEFCAN